MKTHQHQRKKKHVNGIKCSKENGKSLNAYRSENKNILSSGSTFRRIFKENVSKPGRPVPPSVMSQGDKRVRINEKRGGMDMEQICMEQIWYSNSGTGIIAFWEQKFGNSISNREQES